jgi:hypothetical protein
VQSKPELPIVLNGEMMGSVDLSSNMAFLQRHVPIGAIL